MFFCYMGNFICWKHYLFLFTLNIWLYLFYSYPKTIFHKLDPQVHRRGFQYFASQEMHKFLDSQSDRNYINRSKYLYDYKDRKVIQEKNLLRFILFDHIMVLITECSKSIVQIDTSTNQIQVQKTRQLKQTRKLFLSAGETLYREQTYRKML